MVKADPAAPSFFDILPESRYRLVLPCVWGVVQLDEELVPAQKDLVDAIGILNIVNGKIAVYRQLVQPDLRSAGITDGIPPVLIQRENPEAGGRGGRLIFAGIKGIHQRT